VIIVIRLPRQQFHACSARDGSGPSMMQAVTRKLASRAVPTNIARVGTPKPLDFHRVPTVPTVPGEPR
jgi:hypothetical protein